jgi:hypothetical protein
MHRYATVGRGPQDHKEQIPRGLSQQTMMGPTKGLNVTTGSQNRVAKGVGYMAWTWIRISLKSWMVSWYKNEIVQAGVSNCMRQCLNFLVLNIHVPAYLGSRGKPFFQNFEVFLLCLPIVDQYKFVCNNLYCMNLHTLI